MLRRRALRDSLSIAAAMFHACMLEAHVCVKTACHVACICSSQLTKVAASSKDIIKFLCHIKCAAKLACDTLIAMRSTRQSDLCWEATAATAIRRRSACSALTPATGVAHYVLSWLVGELLAQDHAADLAAHGTLGSYGSTPLQRWQCADSLHGCVISPCSHS